MLFSAVFRLEAREMGGSTSKDVLVFSFSFSFSVLSIQFLIVATVVV